MKRSARRAGVALTLGLLVGVVAFLARPLDQAPSPARLHCHDLEAGSFVPLAAPAQVFGVGLTYADHIAETAARFDPTGAPPIFLKDVRPTRNGARVPFPSVAALLAAAESVESGLATTLEDAHPRLDPLLDYEVELGVVLLEDVDPGALRDPSFAPRLGFFIANDLSARALALLGEGRDHREAYWGVSKSFEGFLPLPARAFVPAAAHAAGVPCVTLETRVNGVLRQQQSTRDLVYTPKEMLRFVSAAYPDRPLVAGTVLLTGTPGGVAIATPRWKVRLSELLGLERFTKLAIKLRGAEAFLRPGDVVAVRAEGLGRVEVTVAASEAPAARSSR